MTFKSPKIVSFLLVLLVACVPVTNSEISIDNSSEELEVSENLSFTSYDPTFVSGVLDWADASTTNLLEQLNNTVSFSIQDLRYVYLSFTDNAGSWEAYYFLFNYTANGTSSQLALGFVSIFEGETDGAFVFLSTDEISYDSLYSTFESLFTYSGTTEEIEIYNLIYGNEFEIRRGILTASQINDLLT